MPQRTRVDGLITTHLGKAKQTIELGSTPNPLRKFNRPASVDVRGTGTIILEGTNLPAAFGANLIGKLGKRSEMTDNTGNSTGFNNCYHTVVHYECPLHVITCKTRCNPPYQVGTTVVSEFEIGASLGCDVEFGLIPFMGLDEDRRAECLSTMNPRDIKPAIDIAQQIGELFEGFKALISGIESIERLVKDLNRLNKWDSPIVRRVLGKKTLEDLSMKNWVDLGVAAQLSWTLAVKPMLEAINQAKKARESLQRVLERIVSDTVTLHGQSLRETMVESSLAGNDYHLWGNTRTVKSEVYCTAKVKYHSALTDALREAVENAHFGVVPSLATLYELTPLSFVFDWFWNFGKFLSRSLQKPIDDISYSVLWTGWSRKVTVRSEGWVDVCAGTYGLTIKDLSPPPGLITGTATSTTYLREALPLDLESGVVPAPTLNLPSAAQISTLLALLYALGTSRERFIRVVRPG